MPDFGAIPDGIRFTQVGPWWVELQAWDMGGVREALRFLLADLRAPKQWIEVVIDKRAKVKWQSAVIVRGELYPFPTRTAGGLADTARTEAKPPVPPSRSQGARVGSEDSAQHIRDDQLSDLSVKRWKTVRFAVSGEGEVVAAGSASVVESDTETPIFGRMVAEKELSDPVSSDRRRARLKWFNAVKGFGFLDATGSMGEDVFLHASRFAEGVPEGLAAGDVVEFRVRINSKGPAAYDARLVERRTV